MGEGGRGGWDDLHIPYIYLDTEYTVFPRINAALRIVHSRSLIVATGIAS